MHNFYGRALGHVVWKCTIQWATDGSRMWGNGSGLSRCRVAQNVVCASSTHDTHTQHLTVCVYGECCVFIAAKKDTCTQYLIVCVCVCVCMVNVVCVSSRLVEVLLPVCLALLCHRISAIRVRHFKGTPPPKKKINSWKAGIVPRSPLVRVLKLLKVTPSLIYDCSSYPRCLPVPSLPRRFILPPVSELLDYHGGPKMPSWQRNNVFSNTESMLATSPNIYQHQQNASNISKSLAA